MNDAISREDALALAQATVAAHPADAKAWMALGDRLRAADDHGRAVDAYRRSGALDPANGESFMRTGYSLMALQRFADAADAYRAVLRVQPERAAAWANLGLALDNLGRRDDALAALEKSLAFNPKLAEAHCAVGNILMARGDSQRAIAAYERARAIRPNDMTALCNLSTAFLQQERIEEAEKAARDAIAVAPDRAEPWRQLASALAMQDRPADSIATLHRLLELDPSDDGASAELLYQARQICDLKTVRELTPKVVAEIHRALAQGRKPAATGFTAIAVAPELEGDVTRAWSHEIEQNALKGVAPYVHAGRTRGDRPLRIGYLSADYRSHATMHLIGPLFMRHDRRRVHCYAYSYGGDDKGRSRKRVEIESDHFVDLLTVSDRDAAARIRADEIDILVDLKGHTANTRLAILALRPAPISVSWIGFPGPIGARFIDYALVDRIVVPPEHRSRYVEGLCYLPNCYQINDDTLGPIVATGERAQHGLPDTGFVFASFNRVYKIQARLLDLWARILAAVPGSVLWLYRSRPEAAENVLAGFASRGIDPARIVWAPPLYKDPHLQRIGLADLGLDTFPINGHTTTSDCLRAGLPVVATLGNSFAARVSASLLVTMGLPDLVAPSEDAYVDLAIALARDPARLATVRGRVAAGLKTSPLFDSARFVRNLEAAYETMWRCYEGGELPRILEIEEANRDG
jgi:predicted O-linked N-acetylglucosamine transferase (SPINDLY family)